MSSTADEILTIKNAEWILDSTEKTLTLNIKSNLVEINLPIVDPKELYDALKIMYEED